ncbi:Uncharacterised protein [Serratia quinivorans]|nr:Uncharacterised protein [Serratia quinivorans]
MELKLLLSASVLDYIDSQRGKYSRAGYVRYLLKNLATNNNSSEQREDGEREKNR